MSKLASVGRLLLLALAVAFTVMTFAPLGGAATAIVFSCKDDCGCRNGSESCCIAPSGAVCLDRGSIEIQ
jgi:hypothetical protein